MNARLSRIGRTALVLSMPFASGALHAQTNTTAVSGTVTDATGAMVPGATLTLTNAANGTVATAKAGSKGEYTFDQLMPGTYELRVKSPGFSDDLQQVQLLVATPLKLNFQLTPGNSEVVEVTAGLAEVNSTDATLGKAFDSKQVQQLPYLANNVTSLLALQPGVLSLDGGALTGGLNTDSRTGIVNGARQDQTNVTLDGVDDNDQTNGYAFNGALRATRESVEEFRVTTTNANADAGRSSGAQVSLVTRSGTNSIHGTLYEYYRGVGSANNWINKQVQLSNGQANRPVKLLQHTYGASLGLPIKRDKLFFFGAYEGFSQASSVPVQATVPSIPGGGGLITGNVTYGACNPGVANCKTPDRYLTLNAADIASIDPKCFANGACPKGPGVNQAAIAFYKMYPAANSTTTGDGYNTGTYTYTSPVPIKQITNIAKFDYNLNSKQSVFVRGNLQSDNQSTFRPLVGDPSKLYGNNRGLAAGHVWNITDAISNNFRYGLVRQGDATRGPGGAGRPYVDFAGSLTTTGNSNINALTGNGTSSVYIVTTNNFVDDFTIVKGRHTFQLGFNDRLLSNSRYFDSPLASNATVSANLLFTAAIANSGSSLDPSAFACPNCARVADSFRTFYNAAILAATGTIEYAQSGTEYKVQNNSLVPTAGVPTHIYRNLEQEYYVQDQWKATSRLTFTAGLRYAYLGTPYEKNGQQIAPVLSLNTFLQRRIAAMAKGANYTTPLSFQASGSANNAPNFWTPQKANFAPRVAFAYATSDNKTSIRGGFALAYDHVGQGIIDFYESTSNSVLSLSQTNAFYYGNVDTNPRFTGYRDVPLGPVTTATLPLPYTPPDQNFSFLSSINDVIKTPYAETFNLTMQHEFGRGLTLTTSYVGRLGRHLLANLDVAQPLNLTDPTSGQTYFEAITAMDKAYDAGVAVANMPDSGYFHNIFPNATYNGYKGAQAYYAFLSDGNRGNETNPLFTFDTDPSTSAGGASSFRFFFPQTSSIYAQSTIASSSYNALQVSARQALKYGLVYDVNYTYAKSKDQGSSPERTSANLLANTFAPSQQYAVSDFDVRHNLTGDFVAPLPFGRGRPYLNSLNGLVDRLIGGWQLTGVVRYSTAFPFSAVANGNYGTNFDLPSYFVQTGPIPTGGHNYVATKGGFETALKGITAATATQNLRYAYGGESGQRNKFRADGYFALDNGISKSIHTFGEQSFKLTVEVFNVTNSTRFNAPNSNGGSANFGKYSSLLNNPRQIQFSGKYSF